MSALHHGASSSPDLVIVVAGHERFGHNRKTCDLPDVDCFHRDALGQREAESRYPISVPHRQKAHQLGIAPGTTHVHKPGGVSKNATNSMSLAVRRLGAGMDIHFQV